MQDLIHITSPKSKKDIINSSNYTYLKRAQKIDINDLGIEEGDSFYKTTFPIEKINEFLYQLGGNFTRQNLANKLDEANFIIDQNYDELKKTNCLSEIGYLAVGILRHNLVTSEERVLGALSLIFRLIEENLDRDANGWGEGGKSPRGGNSKVDLNKYVPRIFGRMTKLYMCFPGVKTMMQHALLGLYHRIFMQMNVIDGRLLDTVGCWYLANFKVIYVNLSDQIYEFYTGLGQDRSEDSLGLRDKRQSSQVVNEYDLLKLVLFDFAETFNLFVEKGSVREILLQEANFEIITEIFRKGINNV
jgi:hypothetical protein